MTTTDQTPRARVHEARPWLAHYEPGVPHHVEHAAALPRTSCCPRRAAPLPGPHGGGLRRCRRRPAVHVLDDATRGCHGRSTASPPRCSGSACARATGWPSACPTARSSSSPTWRPSGSAPSPCRSTRSTRRARPSTSSRTAAPRSPWCSTASSRSSSRSSRGTALEHVIVTRIKEYFPPLLWLLYTLTKERKLPPRPPGAGRPALPRPARPGHAARRSTVDEDDTAVLLYTGGTTGVSKGVELSHRNLLVNAEQNRAWARHRRRLRGHAGGRAAVPRLRPDLLPEPGDAHRRDPGARPQPDRHRAAWSRPSTATGRPSSRWCRPCWWRSATCPASSATTCARCASARAPAARWPRRCSAPSSSAPACAPVEGYGLTEAVAGDARQPALRRRPPRHHRPALPRHRGAGRRPRDRRSATCRSTGEWTAARRARRRGPAGHEGLLEPARGDRGAAPRRLAAHRRHRARCTATATSASSTARRT